MKKYLLSSVVWYALSSLTSASAFTCVDLPKNLSKGMESSSVLSLQNFLKEKGYLTAKPNGYFGVGTLGAVKKYQASVGLSRSGQVFSLTRAAIKNETCTSFVVKNTANESAKSFTNEVLNLTNNSSNVAFIEIGKGYTSVASPMDIGGKLAYMARLKNKWIVVFDGKEFGSEYETVSSFIGNDGKLAYVAKNNGKEFVVYDGKKISKEYDAIYNLVSVNKKIGYRVFENQKSYVVYDGVEVAKEYDESDSPMEINEVFSYIGKKGDKEFLIYGNQKLGSGYELNTIHPDSVKVLDGKVLFFVTTKASKTFVVYDGVDLGKEYNNLVSEEIAVINGKLAYVVMKNGRYVVVYDGKEGEKSYDVIKTLKNINGKLAYLAVKDMVSQIQGTAKVDNVVLVYDGKEIQIATSSSKENLALYDIYRGDGLEDVSMKYEVVDKPAVVNNKIAVPVKKNDSWFVLYDGKEVGVDGYDTVGSLREVNKKLAFYVKKNKKEFIVYDGDEVGKKYDSIPGNRELVKFWSVNNKLTFLAEKNNKTFIVMEK